MNIYVSSDHRGFEIEPEIVKYLTDLGLNVITTKLNHTEKDDYPDFAFELGENVAKDKGSLGILMCGSGIGMSIAANKVKGIRAARCTSNDDAFYARQHNDANVLCLAVGDLSKMCELIDTFINTKGAEDPRHLNRVNKVINYEEK